jgi:hypothetical protein
MQNVFLRCNNQTKTITRHSAHTAHTHPTVGLIGLTQKKRAALTGATRSICWLKKLSRIRGQPSKLRWCGAQLLRSCGRELSLRR